MITAERTDPQLFDRFAADYDRFVRLAPPPFAKWLEAVLPAHVHRALDVGCGSGRFTALLAERCDHVIGIDISPTLVDIARRKRPGPGIEYRVQDVNEFSDELGFDLVFSSTTLHHVPDLGAVLGRLRALVRREGTAVLIDNIAPHSPVRRWRHVAGALCRYPGDLVRVGVRNASWLVGFQLGGPWLDHLASDRYLTRTAFEHTYRRFFSGGQFVGLGYAHAVLWRNSAGPVRY